MMQMIAVVISRASLCAIISLSKLCKVVVLQTSSYRLQWCVLATQLVDCLTVWAWFRFRILFCFVSHIRKYVIIWCN